jgi:hypothetical protein
MGSVEFSGRPKVAHSKRSNQERIMLANRIKLLVMRRLYVLLPMLLFLAGCGGRGLH